MRKEQGLDGLRRGGEDLPGLLQGAYQNPDQEQADHQEECRGPLQIQGPEETLREEKGKTHGHRKEEGVRRRQDAPEDPLDQKAEDPQETAQEVQGLRQDRLLHVQGALHAGQG